MDERQPAPPPSKAEQAPERPTALGKYAWVPGTANDFARLKQAEIEREDRGWAAEGR